MDVKFFSAVKAVKRDPQLFVSPIISPTEVWLSTLERKFITLDSNFGHSSSRSPSARAIRAYSNFLIRMVNGLNFWESERTAYGNRTFKPLKTSLRDRGLDWAYLGYTMVGTARLKNLFELLQHIDKEAIPGSVIEAGVWRGGASIYMAGIMNALKMSTKKLQVVADSFQGFPPGNILHSRVSPLYLSIFNTRICTMIGGELHRGDSNNWKALSWYLSVHESNVIRNFQELNLLLPNIYFLKGFFNDSLPMLNDYLKKHIVREGYEPGISLLRMDGNMYQSTVDILYNLYGLVNVGGYVVVDDWTGFPAKDACLDFFKVHGINPKIIPIDQLSVYWKKADIVEVQKWRYEQNIFTD